MSACPDRAIAISSGEQADFDDAYETVLRGHRNCNNTIRITAMYSTKQARYEYIVTDKGRDHARSSWPCTFGGPRTRRTARNVVLVDQVTGSEIVPEFVDHYSGRPLSSMRAEFVAGPDASEDMRRRLDPDRRRARRDRHNARSSPRP